MTLTFVPPPIADQRVVERVLTIAQLRHSPHNCRREPPTAEDTAPLEALILVQGLRVPLEVHAMRGNPPGPRQRYGVFAGRRRYYSIKRLIERGQLPADLSIDCREYVGYADADLVELSISENFRKNLTDPELYGSIARAHKLGHDVDQIARNLGDLDAQLVARWVRLGELAPEVFEALTTGEIDVPRARAYAATPDRKLQALTFALLRRPGLIHPVPADIRKAMKIGDRELERQLLFVGPDEYRGAGGRYTLDLFADDAEQRGRVEDEGLLRELVQQKLEGVRSQAREAVGNPALRFIAEPPRNGIGSADGMLQHWPKQAEGEPLRLPDGVVAHILLCDDGSPEITYWWPSASAKHGAARNGPATRSRTATDIFSRPAEGAALSTSEMSGGGEARRVANATLRDEAGLTADLIEILRSQRRLILRAALVDVARGDRIDGGPGDNFLIFAQLRMLLGHDRIITTGAAHFHGNSGDPPLTAAHLQAMPADRIWRDAIVELQQQPFMDGDDVGAGFLAYRSAGQETKALANAVVAGAALERSLDADGYRIAAQDALATELGLTNDAILRRYWAPTAELLAKLPKDQRAAIAQPFVEAATFAPWPRLKDAQLTENVLQVVTGAHPATRAAQRDAAASWLHPQLRFHPIDGPATRYLENKPAAAVRVLEAAE